MSFTLNELNAFILCNKKIYAMGSVMMHGDAPPTVLSGAAMVYSRELQENRFVHISSCNTPLDWYSSVAAISEGADAAVYSFGRNNCEQHAPHPMGYNDDAYPLVHYVYCRSATRRGRECFNGETPMSSACSSTAVLVITKECGLWFSGDCPVDSSTPGLSPAPAHVFVKIPPNLFHNAGIACIAAGQSHYIAACKLGHVYCWGKNIQYALAEELDITEYANPHRMHPSLFEGRYITSVSAGIHHSAVMTPSAGGIVYQWGQVHSRTTVRSDFTYRYAHKSPVRVWSHDDAFANAGLQSMCCGSQFTLILDDDGRVWSHGLGTCGELGIGRLRRSRQPVRLDNFATDQHNDIVIEISAGCYNSAALTRNGAFYVWGRQYVNYGRNDTTHVTTSLRSASNCGFVDRPTCVKRGDIQVRPDVQSAVCSASHPRLGADSPLNSLPVDLFRMILHPHDEND